MYNNFEDADNEEEAEEEYSGSESEGDEGSTGDGIVGAVCCCYFCLICCVLPISMSIGAAVSSKGLTSCVPGLPTSGANNTMIPDFHSINTAQHQWGNFFHRESNVFNPALSNTSRIGVWRTTKSWYLKDQWAYIAEGSSTPAIVAWAPLFSWMRKYTVKLCSPIEEYELTQNRWGPWRWGTDIEEWEISAGTQAIATATHTKEHQWWGWQVPNGWETTVTSNQLGTSIADMVQSFHSYWDLNTLWYVKDYRPDILPSWVLSFLAVAADQNSGSANHAYDRRLSSESEAQNGQQKKGVKGLEEPTIV